MGAEYEFLQRVVLSIGIGAMIGLEREYTGKQRVTGLRSFALVCFLGCISALFSQSVLFQLPFELVYLPYIGFIIVAGYSFMVFYFLAEKKEKIGITTTLALPLTYLFGMLVGFGFFLEAIIAAVLAIVLLYSRRYSHIFVQNLTEAELADALQFAIVLFLVYPLLPSEPVAILGLYLFLRRFAEIVILFSLISFSGFLSIRLIGPRALPLAGFFAGFVSSVSAVASFSNLSKKRGADEASLSTGVFAANASSILGDAAIIAFASPFLFLMVAPSLAAMVLVFAVASLVSRKTPYRFELSLHQPFSVRSAAKFATAFFVVSLAIQLLSTLNLPEAVYALAFLGGIASVTPVAVSLAFEAGSVISYTVAGQALVLAVAAGMLAKTGILLLTASPGLMNKTAPVLIVAAAAGTALILLLA